MECQNQHEKVLRVDALSTSDGACGWCSQSADNESTKHDEGREAHVGSSIGEGLWLSHIVARRSRRAYLCGTGC